MDVRRLGLLAAQLHIEKSAGLGQLIRSGVKSMRGAVNANPVKTMAGLGAAAAAVPAARNTLLPPKPTPTATLPEFARTFGNFNKTGPTPETASRWRLENVTEKMMTGQPSYANQNAFRENMQNYAGMAQQRGLTELPMHNMIDTANEVEKYHAPDDVTSLAEAGSPKPVIEPGGSDYIDNIRADMYMRRNAELTGTPYMPIYPNVPDVPPVQGKYPRAPLAEYLGSAAANVAHKTDNAARHATEMREWGGPDAPLQGPTGDLLQ